MFEDPNNPRLWLVTGVRHCDVKDCYPDFLADLKEGTILQVYAACCPKGVFKNLRVYTNWQGSNLNIGAISSKMRDNAATYMDDDGFMEVRVVKDGIGDKDFWVEPVLEMPLRPIAQHSSLPPLPFAESLVPFRTEEEAHRSATTRQLVCFMQSIEDNMKEWKWSELREHVLKLAEMLHRYPESCLHSLCEDEDKMLRSVIGQLREIIERLGQVSGMSECVLQLQREYDVIEHLDHEYSKSIVCARIYKNEIEEIERQARKPYGMLTQFFGQLRMDNNDTDPSSEELQHNLNSINLWLRDFMDGWYIRTKSNTEKLAMSIKCEHFTRHELYGYYCCEILAKTLKQVVTHQCSIAEIMGSAEDAAETISMPLSETRNLNSSDEESDPYNIIPNTFDKRRILEIALQADAIIQRETYKYAHLLKVMIDYRVVTIQQSEQAKFAKTIAHWHKDNEMDADKLKGSIRQRISKMMDARNLKTGQILSPFWTWPDTDPNKQICMQIGDIFERNGFGKPRKLIL